MQIAYLAIRWQSWQTSLKTKKLTNIPSPAVGGLFEGWHNYFAKYFQFQGHSLFNLHMLLTPSTVAPDIY